MERRKGIITAAVVSGTLLAGAAGMTLSSGIVGAAGQDDVGELSPVDVSTDSSAVQLDAPVTSTSSSATPRDDGYDNDSTGDDGYDSTGDDATRTTTPTTIAVTTTPTSTRAPTMTTRASGRPKRRRRHAATGARILAAGLATSATLGFASAMADTAVRTAGDDAQPAVVVPDTSRSSPTVTPTNAPPVTTSHAS